MQSSAADPKSSAAAAASGRHDARMVCAIGAGDPTQASRAGATKVIPSKFAIIGPSSRAGARPCCFSRSTSSGCSAPVTAYVAIHACDARMIDASATCSLQGECSRGRETRPRRMLDAQPAASLQPRVAPMA